MRILTGRMVLPFEGAPPTTMLAGVCIFAGGFFYRGRALGLKRLGLANQSTSVRVNDWECLARMLLQRAICMKYLAC